MKYKVGDKVKVRDDLEADTSYGGEMFVHDMLRLCGLTVTIAKTIEKTTEDGQYVRYMLKESEYEYYWSDEMFEEVNDDKDDEAETVKFRAFLEEVANLDADDYDKEYAMLKDIVDCGYNAHYKDKYDYDEAVNGLCNFYRKFTPKKETKKKMTKAEIEDALGYKL